MHDLPPETRGIQHVCLVHARQLLPALAGSLKADASDPFNFMCGIDHVVGCDFFGAVVFGFVFAEVHAAGQLADNHKINAVCGDVRAQRTCRRKLRPDGCRTHIGIQAHSCTQGKQSFFRTLVARQAVPFRTADRAKQYRVTVQALLQFRCRERFAELIDRIAAHRNINVMEGMTELLCDPVHDTQGFSYKFTGGMISADYRNVLFHYCFSLIEFMSPPALIIF